MISCIIPAKDPDDPKLQDLIDSIKSQDFPQDQIEILVITEGDSEQAKAIGIRRAKGEICAMFCADNQIMDKKLFDTTKYTLDLFGVKAVYPMFYHYKKDDYSLNRYFSLIGGNDSICYYLGKNDRWPHVGSLHIKSKNYFPSYGDNGFFYRTEAIRSTDLDHYYPMDNALELVQSDRSAVMFIGSSAIWHRTSDKLIPFLKKRYRYARDLYSSRNDRRWKMLDTREDYWRLAFFIFATVTIIPALWVSIRGFWKIRDWAWFWHWPVCFGFLITYTILAFRNLMKYGRLFQCPSPQVS